MNRTVSDTALSGSTDGIDRADPAAAVSDTDLCSWLRLRSY